MMKFSITVVMISLTSNLAFKYPASMAHSAPAAAAPTKSTGRRTALGSPVPMTSLTKNAPIAPAKSCPSAPMFQTRALNAIAAANPVKISGVACRSVS